VQCNSYSAAKRRNAAQIVRFVLDGSRLFRYYQRELRDLAVRIQRGKLRASSEIGRVIFGRDCHGVDRYLTNEFIRTYARTPVGRFHSANPTIAGFSKVVVWLTFSNGLQKGTQSTLSYRLQIG